MSTTGHISTEPWVKSLEASGTLARERGEYGQELEHEQSIGRAIDIVLPKPGAPVIR